MIDRVGVQTFTVRKLIKTPKELKETFIKLGEIGYKRFELSRLKFNKKELKVLKELKDEYGFEYVTSQIPLPDIMKNFDFLMKFSKELEIPTIEVSVIPMMALLKKKDGMIELANELNILGERTKKHGVELLFHHHNFELFIMEDKLGIEHLFDNTDPNKVNFVCDTYWLARSGFNAGDFVKKYRDRIAGVHLRDCRFIQKGLKFSFKDETVGKGTIDFKAFKDDLFDIDFYSVEQDSPDPLKDLEYSYNYLSNMK